MEIEKFGELPIPTKLDIEEMPEMPPDLTTKSDLQIRQLHSRFNAYFIRANWLVASQEADILVYKNNFKTLYDQKLLGVDYFYRDEKRAPKEKTKVVVDAEVFQNSKSLLEMRQQISLMEGTLTKLKHLRDNYESNCKVLSREASMRDSENKHAGYINERT